MVIIKIKSIKDLNGEHQEDLPTIENMVIISINHKYLEILCS